MATLGEVSSVFSCMAWDHLLVCFALVSTPMASSQDVDNVLGLLVSMALFERANDSRIN